MAKNDMRIKSSGGRNTLPTYRWIVGAGASIPNTGEPLKTVGTASNTVQPLEDGDSTIATDQPFVGLTSALASNTSAAAGKVNVYMPLTGIIYEALATTSGNFDTQSEIDALVGNYITVDVSSSVYTFDENESNNAAYMFVISGGNPTTAEVHCFVRADGTILGSPQV